MKIRLFTIPNSITLGNLVCGSCASVAALAYGNFIVAFWLLIAAAAFDFADGAVARMMRQFSPLGVQLDSLADMVSFGFAPSAILFAVSADACSAFDLGETAVAALRLSVFVIAAFSALRLAKFNIDTTQSDEFCGLPTPACAMFCASLGMLAQMGLISLSLEAIAGIAAVLAVLLVSPVRMFSLKFHSLAWRENRVRYLFLLLSVAVICAARAYSVAAIIVLYVAVSTVRWLLHGAVKDGEQ